MPISRAELGSFTQLQNSFLRFANAKLRIVGTDPEPNDLMTLRDAVFDDRKWIDRFVKAKPCGLSSNELATVSSWHNAQAGNFYVIRVLQSYAVFMGCGKNYEPTEHLYAVLPTVPFDRVLGINLPVVVKTILLPFEGKIVCDGMISFHKIDLGDEVRGGLDGCFAFIKARRGLIRSLSSGGEAEKEVILAWPACKVRSRRRSRTARVAKAAEPLFGLVCQEGCSPI